MDDAEHEQRMAGLEAAMKLLESFEPVLSAVVAYRERLVANGFGVELAEAMAADMHSLLLAAASRE